MKKFYHRQLTSLLLLLLCAFSVQAQVQVSGTVTDATSLESLPGVSIQIKGTQYGTKTNEKGFYSLSINTPSPVLIFTFIGKQTKEVVVGNLHTINVALTDDKRNLQEAVVIGYGTTQKQEVTGSISAISSKDFQKGNIQTPEQLIVGKIAGVSITSNSGQPGVGSTIRIRGGSSLNASNDPLIVIDGMPFSGTGINGAPNPLALINPNDIESMTVLKDAAATAIYGSRASNGVIMITTKKGSSGSLKFNFSTNLSVSSIYRKIDIMTPEFFRKYVDSLGTPKQKALMGNANTNWQNEIYRNAVSNEHNLSISGSTKNMPYRISAAFSNQSGLLITDNLKRSFVGINLNPNFFNNHLKINLSARGSLTKAHYANQQAIINAVQFDPTQPVYDTASPFAGYFEWYSKDPSSGEITLNGNAPRNPVSLIRMQNNNTTVQRSYGNVEIDYKFHFLPELRANANLGWDISKGDGLNYVAADAGQAFNTSGQNNKFLQKINNKVGEFYLNYVKAIPGIRSNINVLAGYGYYDNATTNYNFANFNAKGDTIKGSVPNFPFDKPRNTLISYFGRLIYTFNDRYILAASLRTDGSSRFAPENRWGVFPSAALTWRVNREAWLKDSKVLSDLKLRLSYGITGNQDGIANYSYMAIYSVSTNASMYQFGNNYYNMQSPAAYDNGIKWEQTATWNGGLDFGWLENRLRGSVDVYFKKTSNLLNTVPIPIGSNFSNQILTNVGNIENKGIELNLGATPVQNNKWTWDVNFNLTYNNNKITNLTAVTDSSFVGNLTGGITGGTGQSVQIHSVGYNTFSFYVYKQVYDANGKPLEGVYEDLNKDGIINQKDMYRYKSPAPRLFLGFSTQVSYARWTLGTSLRANLGNYVYNNVASNFGVRRSILNPLDILNNSSTDAFKTNFYNNQYQSDYYITNASFLKMDNLNLGYDVGALFRNKAKLRVNATCQNVFVLTKYKGLDPEVNGGIDYNLYPRPRIFVLGANLEF
ncbi:SusC/RagA family TonB-linked outer membrane protein [Chitinophaga silvatica]|uniref:SusC/RagA family TonB-linked outer membrane protein n=1 Tax=Chitinophaga silvatica TaxID=2282649 RepID=A0A3E1Y7H7_9BACT|nr:SusC/RagA family TonB-linked outer membrane protein [Chitinophaga silvatica]RFS21051.1 SusC/RagA family TonB-linked outer membrane protein [Chitinophaga silvatica]